MIAFFRDLICKDFWLKLFSLVLAVLIWFIVNIALRNEVSPAATLTPDSSEQMIFAALPVTIMSSAEDVRSFQVQPKEVEVTVQGDPRILKTLRARDIRVIVDLTGIKAARDLHKRIEVSTPVGVTHVRLEPDQVQVIIPPKN